VVEDLGDGRCGGLPLRWNLDGSVFDGIQKVGMLIKVTRFEFGLGIISASELVTKLSKDIVLPRWFRLEIKMTKSPFVAITAFVLLSILLIITTGADLTVLSEM
jgi:amino acid transporter